jgi:SAM-dependent methyltransferase
MLHSSDLAASAWVQRFVSLIPKDQGPVLDLACGSGRHTRFLLNAGYDVWSLDQNADLLAPLEALGARCFHVDLESSDGADEAAQRTNWPFDPEQFSGIIVTNYLYRPLLLNLTLSLKRGGILIYETFGAGNEVYGRPRRPDFLLQPEELLHTFLPDSPFSGESGKKNHCIAYEHGYVQQPHPAIVQRICLRSGISAHAGNHKSESI